MRTFIPPTFPKLKSWREERTAPGQWDRITGSYLGNWPSLAAARATLQGKRLDYGLGFFADDDNITAAPAGGGLIELTFSATGLFSGKFRATPSSEVQSVTVAEGGTHTFEPTIPDPVPAGDTLEFNELKPTLDVICAFSPTATQFVDYRAAGKPLSGLHWAVVAAGITKMPDVGQNPYVGSPKRWTYPYGWSYQIIPGDSVGRGASRLELCTFRFIHRWSYVLAG